MSSYNLCLPSVELSTQCGGNLLKEACMIRKVRLFGNERLLRNTQPGVAGSRPGDVGCGKAALANLIACLRGELARRQVKIELEIMRPGEVRTVLTELLQNFFLECRAHRACSSGRTLRISDGGKPMIDAI